MNARKAYLLAYGPNVGTQKAVLTVLDKMPEILNWRVEIPSTVFLITDRNPNQLRDALRVVFPAGSFVFVEIAGSFVFVEIIEDAVRGQNFAGYLDPTVWKIVQRKLLPGQPTT